MTSDLWIKFRELEKYINLQEFKFAKVCLIKASTRRVVESLRVMENSKFENRTCLILTFIVNKCLVKFSHFYNYVSIFFTRLLYAVGIVCVPDQCHTGRNF